MFLDHGAQEEKSSANLVFPEKFEQDVQSSVQPALRGGLGVRADGYSLIPVLHIHREGMAHGLLPVFMPGDGTEHSETPLQRPVRSEPSLTLNKGFLQSAHPSGGV